MSKYKLEIKLLSDLCVSDGGVYNSSLDTDVVHDSYGFPYIPAKRIKGCLRECAEELRDSGIVFNVEELFGGKGNNTGILRIGDACLENIDAYRNEIERNRNALIYHTQNVLECFTYIRTETSIDYDTGAAEDQTLRTIRVVKRGLKFISNIEVQDLLLDDKKKDIKGAFEKCCRILRHMGISRTRGLGEIRCELCEIQGTGEKGNADVKNTEIVDSNTLFYRISLEEPVINKSINGGEAKSLDYLDGGKIIGIIAERLKNKNKDIETLLRSENIHFSNAYLESNGVRTVEVPASYYGIKNDGKRMVNRLEEDGVSENDAADTGEPVQLNQMKHCYVHVSETDSEFEVMKCDVAMEDRYHHRRPTDKSIGRASDDRSGDSMFYQMSSIVAGQSFQGYIYAPAEKIEEICALIKENDTAYIGYARSSEYGMVKIECLKTEKQEARIITTNVIDVKLESAALIYGENASYSTAPNDLVEEILAALGLSKDNLDGNRPPKHFINYGQIGGYNVSWGLRKPIVGVFEKGTVIRLYLKECMEIVVPAGLTIGERTVEGFGEITVSAPDNKKEYVIKQSADVQRDEASIDLKSSDVPNQLAKQISDMLFDEYMVYFVAGMELPSGEKYRPTVSNMLLMCNEFDSLEGISEAVEQRYTKAGEIKKEKKKYADTIIERVKKAIGVDVRVDEGTEEQDEEKGKEKQRKIIEEFCKFYGLKNYEWEERKKISFLKAVLTEMKYSFRTEKKEA